MNIFLELLRNLYMLIQFLFTESNSLSMFRKFQLFVDTEYIFL